ncbi:Putative zinc metalloprotease YwhC [Candidatus Velamenicoccus archaeovorus]|uniref:Zinc metalloprotease YwhC n=1 Tax=Velamenicoccus archaeovorus TaxID=1930593 RepID=A0A410P499_VELA1|nr:site-2 protease family protein [Candidatus Velamenicoccus archaeovorus]QAT16901.1 Putative zinc metalloprotease YwhC [Candidatus Velamenicoccus archaeovorus]
MGILISLLVFFSAIVVHEFSHAFVAYKRGDMTAARSGRLTLNPLAHIDPFGTILLPIFLIAVKSPVLFGWAKPVPIDFSALKNPKKDIIWVGLAGPAANLLLALAATLVVKSGVVSETIPAQIAGYVILVNVILAVFNLVPIPPLDGSRIVMGLLPLPLAIRYAAIEPYGFIILFALLYLGLFNIIVWPIVGWVIHILGLI